MGNVSANDLQPKAQTALINSPICELRELQVEQTGDGLVISGVVSTFYHKQLAQEAVRSTCENRPVEVINSIRVRTAR